MGQQRYYGQKSKAYIEPPQTSEEQNLVLKFKANNRWRNNGFKCLVACDPSFTPSDETTTTTTTGRWKNWDFTLSSPGLLFTIDKGSKTNVVFSHTFTSEKFRKIRSSLSQQEMTSGLVQALKLQLRLLPLLGYLLVLMEKSCCCCCC